MMVHGEPGVGKTHLIGTAQDHPLTSPLLVIDIDGGISTLRHRKDIDVIQVRSVRQLVDAYKTLYNAIPSDPKKKFPYGTVAIDTFSELQQLDLSEIMTAFSKINDKIDPDVPDMRGYGKSGSHMRELLRSFRDLPCNTIFAAHTEQDRDNNMRLINKIKLVGKLKIDVPGFLDIVGFLFTEMEGDELIRKLQFMKTETTMAKDRTGAFDPIEVNPTIPSLWDKLQATNKESK
jgi:phage nucleotide-binding protein